VLGLALCTERFVTDIRRLLSQHEREVADYWAGTLCGRDPLVFFDIVESVHLQTPQDVHIANVRDVPSSLFFEITDWSLVRLMDSPCLPPDLDGPIEALRDVLHRWEVGHNHGNPFHGDARMTRCIRMPTPHAMLVLGGSHRWTSYAFPWLVGRQAAAAWLNLVTTLMPPVPRPAVVTDTSADIMMQGGEPFGPEFMQSICDMLRQEVVGSAKYNNSPVLRESVDVMLTTMQSARDNITQAAAGRSRKAFDMVHLIRCLAFAGFLHNAADFKAALHISIDIVVRDPNMASYFKGLVNEKRTVPSSTTLYRHRLTVTIGFCVWMQDVYAAMMRTDDIISWGTLDGSPNGGYDLELHGSVTMRLGDLPRAFRDSLALCDEVVTADEKAEIRRRLGDDVFVFVIFWDSDCEDPIYLYMKILHDYV
jgi:hypothetical protein